MKVSVDESWGCLVWVFVWVLIINSCSAVDVLREIRDRMPPPTVEVQE